MKNALRQAVALLGLCALPALAQEQAGAGKQSAQAATTSQGAAKESKRARKVIRLEAITVEGRIQKPQAFYILPRSNLNLEEFNRTESFVPKVLKSVEKEPL